MSYKTMKSLGIIFFVIGGISIIGAIGLWFANYIAMQEGYYEYADPIMNTFGVCCCTMLLGFVGIPLLLFAEDRKDLERHPDVPHVQESAGVQITYKYCSFCGAERAEGTNFCAKCGNKFF